MYEQNRVSTAMDAPHFIGQLWQLRSRVRIVSMVSVHCSATSSVQKPFRRWRALPQTKFSVCHCSSWTTISCGEPRPATMGMTPGIGFFSRTLMYFSGVVAQLHELDRPGDVEVLRAAHGDGLEVLVAHDGAHAEPAGARPALLDGREEDPVLAGQADGGDRGVRLLELLADELRGLERAQTPEVRGVADLDLVVVDPEVDQLRGLAAHDHLVVAGVLQLRGPEAAHHREGEQPGLRRDGRDDGAVAAGGRRAGQETGAEDEQVLLVEGPDLGGDPVPQQPGVGAQPSEVKLGQARVRRHPLDASPGEIDLQVEPGLCVPHSVAPVVVAGAAA